MKLVVFGLSITSTWGNGHGTTYRALLRALRNRGHRIVFFEKDVEWYASNRDLPEPAFCEVCLYEKWHDVLPRVRRELKDADVAMVGSYFPDGIAALDEVCDAGVPIKTFYDIDTPITMRALREHQKADYIESRQIPELDIYFSFTGGPMLREIESRFGAPRAVPLYCSFDPEQYRRFPTNHTFACDLSYMGTYAPDRQPKLSELLCETAERLSERKFIVAGPQYPEDGALAAERSAHSTSQSGMASRVLFIVAVHVERYPSGYVDRGTFPFGATVRSGCMRGSDCLRQLARTRGFLCSRKRDSIADRNR